MALTSWQKAQQAIIGSLLIDPEYCAGIIFQKATPAMFNEPSMRRIFEAAQSLWDKSRPIDAVTVCNIAGEDYAPHIETAMQMTPTAANVEAYLDILRLEARKSAMQAEALAIINATSEEEAAEAYERIGRVFQDTEDIEDISLSEMVASYLDRMQDPTPPDYLRLGFEKLDSALAISPGMFVIIGADSTTGKTALALQFAIHIAKSGKRVGFFSLETPQDSLENRIMSELQFAAIPIPSSQQKKLTDDDFRRAMEAGIASENIPLRLIRKATTLTRIRARTMMRRFDVIFVDYLQLIDEKGKDRAETVAHISMGLHRMAQELGVVVIALSQVTPPEKGRKVKITVDDLRESRQLKQDADIVLMMRISDGKEDPPNLRILEVGKNKDGRRPSMKLNFDPQHMTFTHYVSMDDMRADGRMKREQDAADRKAREKAEKAAEKAGAPEIPEDATDGRFAPLPDDGEELPF